MSNYDTVRAITENIEAALQAIGIRFSKKAYDDAKDIPASLMPLGQIFYTGEAFESSHGQRPLFGEAHFKIKVVLKEKEPADSIRYSQKWSHGIRGALTVDALNVCELTSSKLVSRVMMEGVDVDHGKNLSALIIKASVRYREQ